VSRLGFHQWTVARRAGPTWSGKHGSCVPAAGPKQCRRRVQVSGYSRLRCNQDSHGGPMADVIKATVKTANSNAAYYRTTNSASNIGFAERSKRREGDWGGRSSEGRSPPGSQPVRSLRRGDEDSRQSKPDSGRQLHVDGTGQALYTDLVLGGCGRPRVQRPDHSRYQDTGPGSLSTMQDPTSTS